LHALEHALEGGEIQLIHRALVHNRVRGEAAIFLVVERKMLHRGADALALHAFDIGSCELAGDDGVFAKILKISSATRASLAV
jgi:hypothetical protein